MNNKYEYKYCSITDITRHFSYIQGVPKVRRKKPVNSIWAVQVIYMIFLNKLIYTF
jgi:hypothetical protein